MPEAVESRKLLVHVDVPRVAVAARVQVEKVPVTPLTVKVTAPVGLTFVPRVELSVTVAVQTEAWFTTTGLVQLTLVVVVRRLTTTVAGVVVELTA